MTIRVILTAPAPGKIIRRTLAEGDTIYDVHEQLTAIFPDLEPVATVAHLQAQLTQAAKKIKGEADYFPPALLVTESAYDWPTAED